MSVARQLIRLFAVGVLGVSLSHASIVLSSAFDLDLNPLGVTNPFIGMGVFGSNVDLFSSHNIWVSPLYNGSLSFTQIPALDLQSIGAFLTIQSLVLADPSTLTMPSSPAAS